MNQLEILKKELDTKETEDLVGKLYAKRNDKNIFADTPFRCPYCIGGYTAKAFEERYRYRKKFEEHFRFWEQIMQYAYLGGLTLSLAIDKYIESKSEGHTKEEYKDAETNLIRVVETQHSYLIKRNKQKYNEQGELRFKWQLKCFFHLISTRHPSL